MKSKNIPEDIRVKSIKEAQNEIKEIIVGLERAELSLENSMDQYNRMLKLNYHIRDQFKKKAAEINKNNPNKKKKFSSSKKK
tara:strand:- start:452 stop:697 length:246 start_codon:yes stop_codon:yes gene_type:complete